MDIGARDMDLGADGDDRDALSAALQAAALLRASPDPDDALEEALDLLMRSARSAPAALTVAAHLTASPDAADRETGYLLLRTTADLHEDARTQAASAILAGMRPDTEASARVRSAAALALGFTRDPRGVGLLAEFADDHDADVRFHAAFSLPDVCQPYGGDRGEAHGQAVRTLIRLSRDPEPKVRDWATFGLGTAIPADTPEIRAALVERLDDEDGQTRGEAVTGLARRRDPRAVEALAELLAEQLGHGGFPRDDLRDAVAMLAGPQLLPVLRDLQAEGGEVAHLLFECDPAAREQREQRGRFAWELLAHLDRQAPHEGFALGSRRFEPGFELWRTRERGADETADGAGQAEGGITRWDVPALHRRSAGEVDAAARIVLSGQPDDTVPF